MKSRTILAALIALASTLVAAAADLNGRWTAKFDSPIGEQIYTYVFATEEGKLTGTATFAHSMGEGDVKLSDIKLEGEKVSFVEKLDMNGFEMTITYTGKVDGDTMALTREVGDFGTEQITAKRTTDAKP